MRAKQFRIQSDACHPYGQKPRILTRCIALTGRPRAGEQELSWLLTRSLDVLINRLACLIRQLEVDRLPRFSLPHYYTVTLLHVHGHSAIICRYGNYTCQLLENFVLRCDK
jgi:hypothetical protein